MRKRALRKDFYMEIRKSFNRFLSIMLIVALGVAFYAGIQSAAPDMRYSGDAYFDEHKLMDLKVVGTLGLTQDDVDALSEVRGIAAAEPGYMTDVLCGTETQQVLHLESVSPTLNQLTPIEGRLPEKSGECFVDLEFLDSSGYAVGDSITFYREEEDELILKRDTFTIVGAGSSPMYISFSRGNTTLGNGELSGVGYLLPEDFDSEVYTQIYMEVRGARDLTAYTDAYDTLIARVMERVENIEGARCEARYEEVMTEAEQELDDARQELADGKTEGESELADAREELDDARRELTDGQKELGDARKELAEGARKIRDGERELKENEQLLAEKTQELADGKAQLADGLAQLEAGKQELAANESKFNQEYRAGIKEIESGEQQLEAAKTEMEQGRKEYETGLAQYNGGKEEYETGEAAYAQGLTELEAQETAWPQQKAQLEAQRSGLAENQTQLETALTQLDAGLAQAQAGFLAAQQQQQAAQQAVDAKNAEISAAEQQVQQYEAEAANQAGEIKKLEQEIADQQAIVDDGSAEPEKKQQAQKLLDQYKAELANAQRALAEAQNNQSSAQDQLSVLQGALPALTDALRQANETLGVADGQVKALQGQVNTQTENLNAVKNGIAEIDAGIQQAENGFAEGRQKLADTRAQLDAAKKEMEESWPQLEAARIKLEAGEAEIAANEKKLTDGRAQLKDGRRQIQAAKNTIAANEQKLAQAQQQITDGENQLADAQQQIADAKKEISDGKQEMKDGRLEIAEGEQEAADGRKEFDEGGEEYRDGRREYFEEIADAEEKIKDAEQDIADIKEPEWMIDDRSVLPENIGYGENADRMRSLGQVFPALFFLVAALISLTTMTRMVEEERTQIGTLKALGYGKLSIAAKYLCYALFATLGGSIIGILFGEKFLPFVIVTAYKIMYHHMPNVVLPYNMKFALAATCAALFSTMAATMAACYKELAATPAILMRPPTPKEGKRVLLEYIPALWKRLSFSWKSTVRNLFRYKKRFFMTIFGISGCMALMLVGYGLRDSIMDIANLQFKALQIYDGMVILDSESSEEDKDALNGAIADERRIENYTRTLMRDDIVRHGKKTWDIYLMVPENVENFEDFVQFRNRETGETYELTDEGAILTEKIARMMEVGVGDTIAVENEDFGTVEIPVVAITENYLSHYLYLTPGLYEKYFGEKPEFNAVLYRANEESRDQVMDIGESFLDYDAALSISYTASIMTQVDDMLSALDSVIIVLIVSAGLLAFVVLYNLNNININERKRELATIKVLGFYDNEVSAYVYRENILLTIIGVFAGAGLGVILHRFTITTVEVDACMFGRNINLPSFFTAAAFTAGFSIFVNLVMHFKLKKIDMVESLKSVE